MKISKTACYAVVALMLPVLPARADWQYTQWGMSQEQVLAAAGGNAHVAEKPGTYKDGSKNALEGTYTSGDFQFKSAFTFSPSDKLTKVELELLDRTECPSLIFTLTSSYGQATESRMSLGKFLKWWDQKNGNMLVLSDVPSLWCTLAYVPYEEPGQEGGL